jgi:hypothetical protein
MVLHRYPGVLSGVFAVGVEIDGTAQWHLSTQRSAGADAADLVDKLCPTVRVFEIPHPSPIFMNRSLENWLKALSAVLEIARPNSSVGSVVTGSVSRSVDTEFDPGWATSFRSGRETGG